MDLKPFVYFGPDGPTIHTPRSSVQRDGQQSFIVHRSAIAPHSIVWPSRARYSPTAITGPASPLCSNENLPSPSSESPDPKKIPKRKARNARKQQPNRSKKKQEETVVVCDMGCQTEWQLDTRQQFTVALVDTGQVVETEMMEKGGKMDDEEDRHSSEAGTSYDLATIERQLLPEDKVTDYEDVLPQKRVRRTKKFFDFI